jgi:hypothetical protein
MLDRQTKVFHVVEKVVLPIRLEFKGHFEAMLWA